MSKAQVGEFSLAVLALSTGLAFVLALMTWYWFDWPETAQALMVLTLVNTSIALVALVIVLTCWFTFTGSPTSARPSLSER